MSHQRLDEAHWRAIIAEAMLAPSVHNIQPTRVRLERHGGLTLYHDRRRALPVADPQGRDVEKSHGAFVEGLSLALSARGHDMEIARIDLPEDSHLRAFARILPAGSRQPDPLQPFVATRASWRGAFDSRTNGAEAALDWLESQCDDLHLLRDRHTLSALSSFYDNVSLDVLADNAYRAELLSWMRLSQSDANWARDGLNAEALSLSSFESIAAGIALSRSVFPLLDGLGLARPLMGEGGKVRSASAVGLFHVAPDLDAFAIGRRFYRLWLTIESLGLCLCPMSVLADIPSAAERTKRDYRIDPGRTLVNVFRIGQRPPGVEAAPRARLPVEEIILAAS